MDAEWLLKQDQVVLAADLRNYYTHFDTKLESRLPAPEQRIRIMLNPATRLRILCELVILDSLGFPGEIVRERIRSTRRIERNSVPEI
jgi:hypothetical protein